MEGAQQADDGGFAGTGGTDQRGDGAGISHEADAVQDRLVGFVGELYILECHPAVDGRHFGGAAGNLVFFQFGHDFASAIEASEGFGQLRADVHDLEDGSYHESEKHVVAEVVAHGPGMREDAVAAEPHHDGRNQSQNGGGGGSEDAGQCQGLHDVLEQAVNAQREDRGFAFFGVVALDDAHATQGLGEASCDLGIDLAALAEDGADLFEGALEDENKDADDGEHGHGDDDAAMQEVEERENGSDDAAHEL